MRMFLVICLVSCYSHQTRQKNQCFREGKASQSQSELPGSEVCHGRIPENDGPSNLAPRTIWGAGRRRAGAGAGGRARDAGDRRAGEGAGGRARDAAGRARDAGGRRAG